LTVYADTSFLVSLYVPDRHSAEAERRLRPRPLVWFTPLHRAEWTHAIYQHVFQQKMSAGEAQHVLRTLEGDLAQGLWVQSEVPEDAFESCVELARQHCSRLGVRTLDSLHVASALELKAERFWTFDERQARLAQLAGFKTS
jgi:predicted nucleic acid-binding protein